MKGLIDCHAHLADGVFHADIDAVMVGTPDHHHYPATIIGMMAPGENIEIPGMELFLTTKKLQGSLMGSNNFTIDVPHLCDLYLGGRLKLDEMVSRTISLDEINEGFDAMKNGEVVRSVIDFT